MNTSYFALFFYSFAVAPVDKQATILHHIFCSVSIKRKLTWGCKYSKYLDLSVCVCILDSGYQQRLSRTDFLPEIMGHLGCIVFNKMAFRLLLTRDIQERIVMCVLDTASDNSDHHLEPGRYWVHSKLWRRGLRFSGPQRASHRLKSYPGALQKVRTHPPKQIYMCY